MMFWLRSNVSIPCVSFDVHGIEAGKHGRNKAKSKHLKSPLMPKHYEPEFILAHNAFYGKHVDVLA